MSAGIDHGALAVVFEIANWRGLENSSIPVFKPMTFIIIRY